MHHLIASTVLNLRGIFSLLFFFPQLSLIFSRIGETSQFLRKLDLLLLGSFEFVGKKIEEFNLETLNFDLDKFGLCFLCFVWSVDCGNVAIFVYPHCSKH
jgi:hypothetical protein